jgi:hypothetical protein
MQKTSVALEPTACNCLALREAARHVSQIYDAHLALVGLLFDPGKVETTRAALNQRAGKFDGEWTARRLAALFVHWSVTSYRRSEQATMPHPQPSSHGYKQPQGSKLRPRNGARHSRVLKQPSVRTTPRN